MLTFIILLLVGILIIVFIALVLGVRAKARLRVKYPAPGKLVDTRNYSLHLNSKGEGDPTVVVLAGQGDFSLSCQHIQAELADYVRVILYNWASLGWSESGQTNATVVNAVNDLHLPHRTRI